MLITGNNRRGKQQVGVKNTVFLRPLTGSPQGVEKAVDKLLMAIVYLGLSLLSCGFRLKRKHGDIRHESFQHSTYEIMTHIEMGTHSESINVCTDILASPADFKISSNPVKPLQQRRIECLSLAVGITSFHIVHHQPVIIPDGVKLPMTDE